MENFENLRKKQHLREVLLYHFFTKRTAAAAHRLLVECYGQHALSRTQCAEWFQRFKNGDFDVGDKERTGKPKKFDDQELKTLLDDESCHTQEELAKALNVSRSAVSRRLKRMGMIQTHSE